LFNATFNNISVYIVAVNFIDGGNRSTRRKPLTCRMSLTNLHLIGNSVFIIQIHFLWD